METGEDSPVGHSVLPPGPGGNPVCEVARRQVVCWPCLDRRRFCMHRRKRSLGRTAHLSHLPGTGKHSWDAVFSAMNLTLLFLDPAHQIPISPSAKENDKIMGL